MADTKEQLEAAMSSIQADMHEICEWLTKELEEEGGQINDKSLVLTAVIDKIKDHDLWT